jgi:secreted Zn-dependent insulinase-like peptidase
VIGKSYNEVDDNSALYMMIQVGRRRPRDSSDSSLDEQAVAMNREVTLRLLEKVASPLCFDNLRTKDGLGYTVSCFSTCARGAGEVCSFDIVVQGNAFAPSYMHERVELFLHDVLAQHINTELTAEKFKSIRHEYCKAYTKPPKSVSEASSILWRELGRGMHELDDHPQFDELKKMYTTCNNVTLNSLRDLYSRYIISKSRRKLAIELYSHKHAGANIEKQLQSVYSSATYTRADVVSGEIQKDLEDRW